MPIHTHLDRYKKDLQRTIAADGMSNLLLDRDFSLNMVPVQNDKVYRLQVTLTCPTRCFKMAADCSTFGEQKTVSDCAKNEVEGQNPLASCEGRAVEGGQNPIALEKVFLKGKVYTETNCKGFGHHDL